MKVELVNGKIIDQDTFLVKRWDMLLSIPFDDLKWHDQVVYFIGANNFKEPHKYDMDKELCYLYGSIFGSSTRMKIIEWKKKYSIRFIKNKERLIKILDRLGIEYKTPQPLMQYEYQGESVIQKLIPSKENIKIKLGVWVDVFKDDGVLDYKIPENIINGPKENALAFLDGFYDQSVFLSVDKKTGRDYYCCHNDNIIQEFFKLLPKLGYDIFKRDLSFTILKKVNEQTMKIVPIKKIYSPNK